ncbi:universal stress protein, partial [Kribbella sp. NPDC050281]|uniref:universal stress protein n=1 Tax=Kribbella sp. NPDC050281 TaxID=3155515 RepID=UPI0033EDE3DA
GSRGDRPSRNVKEIRMNAKPVVVGIDGSPAAHVAIRWASAEAASLRTRLRLISAVPAATILVQASGDADLLVISSRGLSPVVVVRPDLGTELHKITEAELREAVHARHDAELIQITGHPVAIIPAATTGG